MRDAVIVTVCVLTVAMNIGLVAICLKIYTEIMKEHTIRRRYEAQLKSN
ncbi:hypothetical protein [Candidatus Magnetobacterium casense]|uniref:Uncharacterized protein n=1 Tax=Candidatus Magnetobacterium casense TaxID=1455061 RepID=A0ABS6S1R2_9BACT|nr:hypothetical protein [Candidatus Magnetobacterium casensis]MBV6342782.1 hypothetical protein [Candidatus Magnetobacterium casensis]